MFSAAHTLQIDRLKHFSKNLSPRLRKQFDALLMISTDSETIYIFYTHSAIACKLFPPHLGILSHYTDKFFTNYFLIESCTATVTLVV